MKKFLIAFAVLALIVGSSAFAADSPFGKGAMMIGGTAGFTTQSGDLYENSDGDSYSEFGIMPEFGYFVSPGFVVGGMLDISSASQGDYDASWFGFGPYVGYYFGADKMEIKGKIFPFLKAFFSYESVSINDADVTGTSFGGMAGVDYMVSNAVAVQAGVQFSSDSVEPDGFDSVSGTTMQIGLGVEAFVF